MRIKWIAYVNIGASEQEIEMAQCIADEVIFVVDEDMAFDEEVGN